MVRSRAVNKIGLSCVVFFVLAAVLATPSGATIIRFGDGSGNTDAPADDPGWANVGSLASSKATASGVYLGNGWVLTAAHVGAGTFYLDDTPYSAKADSWHQLHHPEAPGWAIDLGLFQLAETPVGLPSLAISKSAPGIDSPVVGIGYGRNRAVDESRWNGNWGEVFPPNPGAYQGFYFGSGSTKRWGTNRIYGTTPAENTGQAYTLDMDFSQFAGDAFEMQAVPGDSGGGLFYKNEGDWELAGIIVTQGRRPGQPDGTAVYGNTTRAVDLSRYRDQILILIPEPSALAMLLGLGVGCLVWAVWRRASRPAGR